MTSSPFQVISEFQPLGDQPAAIDALTKGIESGEKYQTLLGVTGSGKTFTMANTIARVGKPTLVISHNKTLAAQLYEEFKELLPHNAVSYFVSYYDYYQPEAYIPQRDIYIEKDCSRNDDLDRLRLAATSSLVSRRDVVVVASVSCIFGLGSPEEYKESVVGLLVGQTIRRKELLTRLSDLQYRRSEMELARSTFRVRGDVIEVYPAAEEHAWRIEMFGDQIEALQMIHPISGETILSQDHIFIYPAVHYVIPQDRLDQALASINEELEERVRQLRGEAKLVEAQRLTARTKYDLEVIQEIGYCSGIENYSRHLDGRSAGSKPYTLLDYFPADDWLLMIDESHVTLPQLRAMYHSDRHRKQVLVDHGFRLPSALDNRPMCFEEIEAAWSQLVFVSATPGPYELEQCGGAIVEQIIRPTGLVDPEIEVRPAGDQVPDLLELAQQRTAAGQRTLVTTLTKRLAEDLATYLSQQGMRCRYLHSEIETLDRVVILRELREGKYDVLVGVNLLREGLDLPEVSLVAIMDADKTGFLRSTTSLIQQIGRAARNVDAAVILYADTVTPAMQQAMDETDRRRGLQMAYNQDHDITPKTVQKAIRTGIERELRARETVRQAIDANEEEFDRTEQVADLETQMLQAAKSLEFEKAAALRDKIKAIKESGDLPSFTEMDSKPQRPAPGTPGVRRHKTKRRSSSRR